MSTLCALHTYARCHMVIHKAYGSSFNLFIPPSVAFFKLAKADLDRIVQISKCWNSINLTRANAQPCFVFSYNQIRPYSTNYQRSRNARALSLSSRVTHADPLHEDLFTSSIEKPSTSQATQELYLKLVDDYDSKLQDIYSPHSNRTLSDLSYIVPERHNKEAFGKMLDRTATVDKSGPCSQSEKHHTNDFQEVLQNPNSSNEQLFNAYRRLPVPRTSLITLRQLRTLLSRLSAVPQKSELTMMRYFAILEDMRASNIPLQAGEWNSAISFAGRYVSKVSDKGVSRALNIWKDMEKESGVSSTIVTFNILFDVATKAGKLYLADLIRQEMARRSLTATRYTWVNLIQNSGFRGDSEGVRNHYKDLVRHGQIVDTVVLNAMMSALLDCGEPSAADQIYQRMKRLSLHQAKMNSHRPLSWQDSRALAATLLKASRCEKAKVFLRRKYPLDSLVAPDARTYRILIPYHCLRSGDLEKVAFLIHDMQLYQIPLTETVFSFILKGFYHFGNTRYTSWTGEAFDGVWKAYIAAIDRKEIVKINKSVIKWALIATATTKGDSSLERVWKDVEVRSKWTIDEKSDVDTSSRKIRSSQNRRISVN